MIIRQRTLLQNDSYQQKTAIVDIIDDKPKISTERTILPQINISNKTTSSRQQSSLYGSSLPDSQKLLSKSSNLSLVSKVGSNANYDLGNAGTNSSNQNQTHQQRSSNKKSSAVYVDSAGKEGPRPCNEAELYSNYLKKLPIPATEIENSPVFSSLNFYEKGEAQKLLEKNSSSPVQFYYFGLRANKLKPNETGERNHGHDDEHGGYLKVTGDQVLFRYELFDTLGKGSFGQVIRAFDHKQQRFVALKIIRNKRRFHTQALIEVEILEKLKEHDKDSEHNIIHLQDWFYFRNHLCITFELLGMNLYELIKINSYQGFSFSLIKRFAYSILQCLVLFQQLQIIHCDLKPENILLQANFKGTSAIKVIDVGSSCFVGKQVYTYIQSRFYRSPEVILGLDYSLPIDIWSFGCILAELYTGYPIFPGENEIEQLNCIMEIFGPPPSNILRDATRRKVFFDSKNSPRCLTNSKGKKRRPSNRTLEQSLKNCSNPDFLDFVRRCLNWDPSQRMDPQEALEHPFLSEAKEHYRRKKRKQHSCSNQQQLQSQRRNSSTRTSVNNFCNNNNNTLQSTPLKTLPSLSDSLLTHRDSSEKRSLDKSHLDFTLPKL